ncbi:hypothetical protein VBD025_08580 [Virgibacillus flavescens]|uniref:hypothetical protein n=1 Tax=Virgibacillus flavescens TaxID=1611422 RepID=UPI003D326924
MNIDNQLLNKMAKKHKKLFESYSINPGAYQIQNNDFFLVSYKKKGISGCAVLSPQCPDDTVMYMEAFDSLLEHAQLTTLILRHAGDRADINMSSFYTVKQFLEDVIYDVELRQEDKNVFETCLSAILKILELQEYLIKSFEEFYLKVTKLHEGEINVITKDDIEEMVNYLGEVGYIQYTQLLTQYRTISKFGYIKNTSEPNISKYITDDVSSYLVEFSSHKKQLNEQIKSITYQTEMDRLTKEEHIEVEKKNFRQNLEKTNASLRKKLRFP